MKKFFTTTSISILVLMLFLLSGCGGEKGTSTSGAAGGVNLLTFLPENASGVFTLNFTEVAKLDLFDKMIKEAEEKNADSSGEGFKDYQDFVTKTGIDPKKDIHGVAVAVLGKLNGSVEPDGLIVVNLSYDKAKVLAILTQKKVEFTEEMYKGIAILSVKKENEKNVVAFINDSVVAVGKIDGVKKVIDLSKGEGRSVMDNARLKPYIAKFRGMISFVIDFPEDAKKVHKTPMAEMDLTNAEVILGEFNYASNTYTGEISMICNNEEGNTKLVTTVNGLKGMAAMMGPEVGELANKLILTASADKVTLSFAIPQELLDRLQKALEEKNKGEAPEETETETETETE